MVHKRFLGATLSLVTLGAAVSIVVTAPPAHAKTFVVNQTSDEPDLNTSGTADLCDTSGEAGVQCTLRAAIMEANTVPGPDVITFKIPGAGRHTIKPESDLPNITETVTINGYTEPGASPNSLKKGSNAKLMIALDGEDAGLDTVGLHLDNVTSSVIKGLVIKDFQVGGGAGGHGIRISGIESSGNRIQGNFIGTNFAGTASEGNAMGVFVGGSENFIGGESRAARNVISGNTQVGVIVASLGSPSEDHEVRGNLIGVARDASTDVGNAGHGVLLLFSSSNLVAGNSIAFNGGDGVSTEGPASSRNDIRNNSIYFNGGQGIDIGNDGRTLNDVDTSGAGEDDLDVGPNLKQNFPVITEARTIGGATTIVGSLSSTGNESPDSEDEFVVRLYSNPPDTGEGKKLVSTFTVFDTSNAPAPIDAKIPAVPVGNTITATATDDEGNTSEFSDPRFVRRESGAN